MATTTTMNSTTEAAEELVSESIIAQIIPLVFLLLIAAVICSCIKSCLKHCSKCETRDCCECIAGEPPCHTSCCTGIRGLCYDLVHKRCKCGDRSCDNVTSALAVSCTGIVERLFYSSRRHARNETSTQTTSSERNDIGSNTDSSHYSTGNDVIQEESPPMYDMGLPPPSYESIMGRQSEYTIHSASISQIDPPPAYDDIIQ